MCWTWAFTKRIFKYPFRIVSHCRLCLWFGFGKYSSSRLSLLSRMSTSGTRERETPVAVAPKRDISTFRLPTRFIGEIHVVLSALVIISCIGTLVSMSIRVSSSQSSQAVVLVGHGYIVFSSITLITSLMDVGLSFLLIRAAKEVNLDKCLFWYRSTITSLIAMSLFTVAFGVLIRSWLVLLGLLPSLIFKPFALWLVSGFIEDIYIGIRKSLPPTQIIVPLEVLGDDAFDNSANATLLRQTSSVSGISHSPNTATTSLGSYDQEDAKRKTTVFLLNKQVSRDHSSDPDGVPRSSSEVVTLTRIKNLPPE